MKNVIEILRLIAENKLGFAVLFLAATPVVALAVVGLAIYVLGGRP